MTTIPANLYFYNHAKTDMYFSGNTQNSDMSQKKVFRGRFVFYSILFVVVVTAFGAGAGTWFLYRLYETLPTHNQLQNIEPSLVSKVYDRNGESIHEFSIERRFWVPLEQMPEDLQNAVIAIEDRKFYKHWGIDIHRIFGAIVADIMHGKLAQGASTLTQQLARNLYLTHERTFLRKIREALTAIQLERNYTKKEIFELYLNQVYLGAGVYGVQAASEHYFSKSVSELTLEECAIIAGIIQRPEHHRPDKEKNIDRITARRNTVLRSMAAVGYVDQSAAKEAVAKALKPNPKEYRPPIGPYYMEMVRRYVAEKYGDDQLYNGGLEIHTTLDPVAQDSAEKSVSRKIASLQKRFNRMFLDSTHADRKFDIPRDTFLTYFDSIYALHEEEFSALPDSHKLRRAQASVVALDVGTGAILALVGGRDFDQSKFNRAVQARRQPGSAFKPFVYTAALDNGFNPATVVLDQPITLITPEGDEWRPENYDRKFHGPLALRDALAKSNNLVAIQVFNKVGGDVVVDYARRMGLEHRMEPVPSLAIGACEVTPLEIISAYSIYPNKGVHVEPYFIEKIVDKNGRVLEKASPEEKIVLTPQTSYLMSSLMKSVVCCGTGSSIPGRGFSRPAGGKTGTTNDYTDAWFIGFTPQVVCGVWTGVDEQRSMGRGVTGSSAAIPIWVDAMKVLHRDKPVENFSRPGGIISEKVCKESHLLANRFCPETETEYFKADTELDTCEIHSTGRPRREGGGLLDLFGPSKRKNKSDSKKKRLMF